MLIALALLAAGALTWLLGSILKACVSRQREYLADATAVQLTRQTRGIAGALRKIAEHSGEALPAEGSAYSHLYFDNRGLFSSLFATHPPLNERIERIEKQR